MESMLVLLCFLKGHCFCTVMLLIFYHCALNGKELSLSSQKNSCKISLVGLPQFFGLISTVHFLTVDCKFSFPALLYLLFPIIDKQDECKIAISMSKVAIL